VPLKEGAPSHGSSPGSQGPAARLCASSGCSQELPYQGPPDLAEATITFDAGKEIPAAVAKAKDADVVILGLGEWRGISGEGFNRSSLDLPCNQEQLLEAVVATGKPIVLVLENGRPLTIG
jgi:hypothetical protein